MGKFFATMSFAYFVSATILLMLIAGALLVSAVWQLALSIGTTDLVKNALDSAGLLIIGFAIVETAKFFVEEEILRRRELRSSSRRPSRHW